MSNIHFLPVRQPTAQEAADMMGYRKSAAKLARTIRAMWPTLDGSWTRRDWNNQVRSAAYNHISRLRRFDRMNREQKHG